MTIHPVEPDTPAAEQHKTDQRPCRHRQSEETPGNLRTLSGTGQNHVQHLEDREGIEHEIESGSARGYLVFGQVLQPDVPACNRSARQGSARQQHGIDPLTGATRRM